MADATPGQHDAKRIAEREPLHPGSAVEPRGAASGSSIVAAQTDASVTDVQVVEPRTPAGYLLSLCAAIALAAGISVVLCDLGLCRQTPRFIVFFVSSLVTQLAVNWYFRRRGRRRMAGVARNVPGKLHANLALLVRDFAEGSDFLSRRQAWAELARQLAAHGRVGETLRLSHTQLRRPVEPLIVPFEPRPLDEADGAFLELDTAVATGRSSSSDNSGRSAGSADQTPLWRRLRRNLRLRGGPVILGILLLGLVVMSAVTWSDRLGRSAAVPFAALLVFVLCLPATGGLWATKQWFLVPGGVACRKARVRDRASRVHLFKRRSAILCAYQYQKHQWVVSAADAEAADTTLATDKEVDLLLRAWLSPVPPPAAEQLSDLV